MKNAISNPKFISMRNHLFDELLQCEDDSAHTMSKLVDKYGISKEAEITDKLAFLEAIKGFFGHKIDLQKMKEVENLVESVFEGVENKKFKQNVFTAFFKAVKSEIYHVVDSPENKAGILHILQESCFAEYNGSEDYPSAARYQELLTIASGSSSELLGSSEESADLTV